MAGKVIVRKQDWPEGLKKYLSKAALRPFVWGAFDCCTFVSGGIKAMTGKNPDASFPLKKVKDKKTAFVVLMKFAGGGVEKTAEKIADKFGFEEIPALKAGRGDVVLVENNGDDALGLIDLSGCFAAVVCPETGFGRHPLSICKRAWRIP